MVRQRLEGLPDRWRVMFTSLTPVGVTFMGRNHPLVEALAEYLFDLAFHPTDQGAPASRCGVIRTTQVDRRTTLLLLRLRYLIYERGHDTPSLAEETVTWGFVGLVPEITRLSPDEAERLMETARADANVPASEKQEVLQETLAWWSTLQGALRNALDKRARHLEETHHRIRQLISQHRVRIEPQLPPDLLGIVVLLPVPRGVRR